MELSVTKKTILALATCVCIVRLYYTALDLHYSTQNSKYPNWTQPLRNLRNNNYTEQWQYQSTYAKQIVFVSNVPRIVWAFWFGRPMQGSRLKAWKSLQANIGIPVTLVTDETLSIYNVSSHPMHRGLDLKRGMSMNHIVDYLRVYFMHHYGGGYHDVKPQSVSWGNSFDIFKDPNVWVLGIPETGPWDIGCREDYVTGSPACEEIKAAKNGTSCCKLVSNSWKSLVANCAYISRPNTNLTYEWLTNVERHLENLYERIKAHPAPKPRCCQNGEPDYPVGWAELHGDAFHPLQWKYNEHVRHGLPPWAGGEYIDVKAESSVYNSTSV